MKRVPPKPTRAAVLAPILTALFACMLPFILAEVPAWWGSRGVVKKDGAGNPVAAVDFAAANQGQLKEFVIATYEEFLATIPAALGGIGEITPPVAGNPADKGSPGWRIRHLAEQWVVLNTDGTVQRTGGKRVLTAGAAAQKDFAAINLGQIKAMAAPFYDRLAELYWSYNSGTPATSQIDPAWAKPWTDAPGDANNHAMATLGQLKHTFAIHLDSDGDGDGLTNLTELLANKFRSSTDRTKWTDLGNAYTTGGVLTDGEQYDLGLDPTDPSSGAPPAAPTGLHITFPDATVHPLDPDLSHIHVEWNAPPPGATVTLFSTYAGDAAGWVPVALSSNTVTLSPPLTAPYSKRTYQYRVTFTNSNNGLTASTDIAYELPVIRGILQRTNDTGFAFRGALLYADASHSGVPRKFCGFKYEWTGDTKAFDAFHDHGNFTLEIDLPTRQLTKGNESHTRTDYYSYGGGTPFTSWLDDVVNSSGSVQPFPLSLDGEDWWTSDWKETDWYYIGGVPKTSYEHITHGEGNWEATWQKYPFIALDGTPLPPRPIGAFSGEYQRSDIENDYESDETGGTSASGTLSLVADGFGQHYGSSGTESYISGPIASPIISDPYLDLTGPGGAHRIAWALYPLHPGEFSVIGTYEPPFFDLIRQGERPVPDGADVISFTAQDGSQWSRKWDFTSGSNKDKWEEKVTLTGETTTPALVAAAVGSFASFDDVGIGWYVPYPPSAQEIFTNTSFIGGSNAGIDWNYTASYTSGAADVNLDLAGYPVDGYVTVPPNLSGLVGKYSLSADETGGQLRSSEYKFRIYPPAESCEIQWVEKFSPASTGVSPRYRFQSAMVLPTNTETGVHSVDRTQGFELEPTAISDAPAQQPTPQADAPNAPVQGQVAIAPPGAIQWRERAQQIHRGFDPPLRNDVQTATVAQLPPFIVHGSDDKLSNHHWWASVVKSGPGNKNQSLQVWFNDPDFAKLHQLVVPAAFNKLISVVPERKPLQTVPDVWGGHSSLFEIHSTLPTGPTADTILEAAVELWTIEKVPKKVQTLRVMVLPEVKVDLAILRVENSLDGATSTPETKLPAGLPSNALLIERLNDVWQQAGVTFVLNPASDDAVKRIHYDLDGDNELDIAWAGREMQKLQGSADLKKAKLNLVLLRGPVKGQKTAYANVEKAKFTGITKLQGPAFDLVGKQIYQFTFWSECLPPGIPFTANPNDMNFRDFTGSAAHELGHALGLSTRRAPDPKMPGATFPHDPGVFPEVRWSDPLHGLMYEKANVYTKWLRHEDWYRANRKAALLFFKP